MGILREIQSIRNETFVLGILDTLFLILPGVMVIFLYNLELFQSLDWIKLILISAAITLPFNLINIFSISILSTKKLSKKQIEDEGNLFFNFSTGIIMTGIIIYVALGCLYTFGKPLKSVFIFVSLLELFLVIWIITRKKQFVD
jgi:hypothetical protein